MTEIDRLTRALRCVKSYVIDDTVTSNFKVVMIGHWVDETLAGHEIPDAAMIPGPS